MSSGKTYSLSGLRGEPWTKSRSSFCNVRGSVARNCQRSCCCSAFPSTVSSCCLVQKIACSAPAYPGTQESKPNQADMCNEKVQYLLNLRTSSSEYEAAVSLQIKTTAQVRVQSVSRSVCERLGSALKFLNIRNYWCGFSNLNSAYPCSPVSPEV